MGLLERWFGKGSRKRLDEILISEKDFPEIVGMLRGYLAEYGPLRTGSKHDVLKQHLIDKAISYMEKNPKERFIDDYAETDLVGIVSPHEIASNIAMNIAPRLLETARLYGEEIGNGSGKRISWMARTESEKKGIIDDFFSGCERLAVLSDYNDAGKWDVSKAASIYFSHMLKDIKETIRQDKEEFDRNKDRMTARGKSYAAVMTSLKYNGLVDLLKQYKDAAELKGFAFDASLIGELNTREKEMSAFMEKVRPNTRGVLDDCMRDVIYDVQAIMKDAGNNPAVNDLCEKLELMEGVVRHYSLEMPKEMKQYELKIQKILGNYV